MEDLRKGFTMVMETISPLLQTEQTDDNGKTEKVIKAKTKKLKVFFDDSGNKVAVNIPVYSGNGWRGMARRIGASIIVKKAKEKGYNLTTDDFHVLFSGGSPDFTSGLKKSSYEEIEKLRQANPLISLLGAGFIEGKLIITDFIPTPLSNYIEKRESDDGDIYFSPKCLGRYKYVTKDDLLDYTKYGRLMSVKDIREWEKESMSEHIDDKQQKKVGGEKSKSPKKSVRQIGEKEYILPYTILLSNISFKTEPTKIEYGFLLKIFEQAVKEQIGASRNIGFGVVRYFITQDELFEYDLNSSLWHNQAIIKTTVSPVNIYSITVNIDYTDRERNAINEFEKWLDNITADNVLVYSNYIKTEKKV